jgi:hypothetical protein
VEALGEVGSAVGIEIDDYGTVEFDELGPRLKPELAGALFQQLRRRYDEVLDKRLLGDRTSRPMVQPERPRTRHGDGESVSQAALSWRAFERDVDAEMQKLLATARYSLRLAAQEGDQTHHLKRSVRNLAQAADWYGMLVADGRSGSETTVSELQSLRGLLDRLIDERLNGVRGSTKPAS